MSTKKRTRRRPIEELHPQEQMLQMIRAINHDPDEPELVGGESWAAWALLNDLRQALDHISPMMDVDHGARSAEHDQVAHQIERWMAWVFANSIIFDGQEWEVVPRAAQQPKGTR
jgi:hypothetical protein